MPPFGQQNSQAVVAGAPARKITPEEDERVREQLGLVNGLEEVKSNSAAFEFERIKRLYGQNGLDIETLYKERETRKPEIIERKKKEMHEDFLRNKENSPYALFAELLPLLANKPGRLGPYISARVTRTAKPDDAGNSFVDLVFELRNDYLKTEEAQKDKLLRTIRPTTAFAVDVTTDPEKFKQKENDFTRYDLKSGDKANILAYEQKFPGGITKLGIDVPKCIVLRNETALANVANRFKRAVQMIPGKGIMITDEKYFDSVFKDFFGEYLDAVVINAERHIEFLREQKPVTPAQNTLIASYQSVVDFYAAYKKTPTTLGD